MALAALVLLGGAAGAVIRYLVGRALNAGIPWGTFAVNVGGAALLGGLVGANLPAPLLALLGSGLCGALTTWSTLSTEIVALGRWRGSAYGLATVACGLVAAGGGWWLGHTLA
jgi:CrcB protein